MIEKEDVKQIKNIENFEQFERAVLENFNAVDNVGETEILIPINKGRNGYHVAVVEVTEEEIENLSEGWREEVGDLGD